MNKAPKIGARVRYKGGLVVGPCIGTVMAIYKCYEFPEDFDWESDQTPPIIGVKPEKDWHASVKVDETPELWAYSGQDSFAPCVAELSLVK